MFHAFVIHTTSIIIILLLLFVTVYTYVVLLSAFYFTFALLNVAINEVTVLTVMHINKQENAYYLDDQAGLVLQV